MDSLMLPFSVSLFLVIVLMLNHDLFLYSIAIIMITFMSMISMS